MQTREKPPVVVHPDVAHLMNGPMIEIRELVVDRAAAVAESRGVGVAQVRVNELYYYEDDLSKVVFVIRLSDDDDSAAFAYWEAVDNAIWNDRGRLSKSAQALLEDEVTIFAEW
jgi:hypothetical protein